MAVSGYEWLRVVEIGYKVAVSGYEWLRVVEIGYK